MLEVREKGKNSSWAICWHAVNFLKIIMFYILKILKHIGNDEHSTNYALGNDNLDLELHNFPIEINESDVLENSKTSYIYESMLKTKR